MTYKTIAGDCWDLIAYKTLGSSKYTEQLINANRHCIETFIFNAGVELTIPDITEEIRTADLPAWLRRN